jgi:cell division protein FtsI (penicillin-binding protein 3)
VVLDVETGEVLAMANQPAGNPNNRAARKPSVQRNRAVTDLFEPGSTLKPFTVIAALESARVNGNTVIDTTPGYMRVGRSAVRDVHDYGQLTVAGIIRKSSNVGIAKLALDLPEGELWRLYAKLGFGVSTASAFPGEAPGYLSHHSTWNQFELATHSFGYGLSVTALQLARAYLAIASDGILREPSLVKVASAVPGKRVMSAAGTRTVRAMMQAVVAEDGTAPRARVPGYTVAGKTGTVKKNAAGGGYEEDRFLALFAGMIPATKPRLVMVVMIDDPRGEEYYGGLVAAPVFAKVMTAAMRLLDVPPDDLPLERVQSQPATPLDGSA